MYVFFSFLPQSPHLKLAALRIKLYLDIKHDTYKYLKNVHNDYIQGRWAMYADKSTNYT